MTNAQCLAILVDIAKILSIIWMGFMFLRFAQSMNNISINGKGHFKAIGKVILFIVLTLALLVGFTVYKSKRENYTELHRQVSEVKAVVNDLKQRIERLER